MDQMMKPPGMEDPAPSMDPLDAGAPPAAPSLVLSPEQMLQFGVDAQSFAGLPDGSTVTATVTFKTSLAGLEVQNIENVMPDEADPVLPDGAPPESELADGEPSLDAPDAEEKAIGYKRPVQKSKKGGFPVDMKKMQSQF
jgi:hypothetical protein